MKKLLIIPMFFSCLLGMGQASAGGGKHFIGEKFAGGIVFNVSPDGKHGLIAETQDQGRSCKWPDARKIYSDPTNHSAEGKSFIDWRLPNLDQINLLYLQKSLVGGFADNDYFSSQYWDNNGSIPILLSFKNGKDKREATQMRILANIRTIRSF